MNKITAFPWRLVLDTMAIDQRQSWKGDKGGTGLSIYFPCSLNSASLLLVIFSKISQNLELSAANLVRHLKLNSIIKFHAIEH